MKKTYKVEVDCADCAANIEEAIGHIDGVDSVVVNFMTQKLKIDADEARLDAILDEAQKVGTKIEPEFVIHR